MTAEIARLAPLVGAATELQAIADALTSAEDAAAEITIKIATLTNINTNYPGGTAQERVA